MPSIKIDDWSKKFKIFYYIWQLTGIEAVVQRCSVKKVFLEISQNSQENTCARASSLIKLQELGLLDLGLLFY